ncbi:MAG: hypothetical protein QOJ71_611, partial [Actinomycetota bacterium]|nr:hypothetical protein [Actinomycetota bacterium]
MSYGFPEFRRLRSGRALSRTLVALAVPAVVAVLAAPAGACGGLVG